jgi:hypothetical protein
MTIAVDVCIASQLLTVMDGGQAVRSFVVSTAKNGPGQRKGSECTPLGWHSIRAKIGADQPINTVFVGRRLTGELYSPKLASAQPQRDWILSRILWLGGLEPGYNRFGDVDSASRYIYIHGCPDELMRGQPASHGCIRMFNADVVELFDLVQLGSRVLIHL